MENLLSDDGGLPAKNGTGFSRREVLLGLASTLLAGSLLSYPFLSLAEQQTPSANPLQFARFFKISQTLTEHQDIDQGMSARILLRCLTIIPSSPHRLSNSAACYQRAKVRNSCSSRRSRPACRKWSPRLSPPGIPAPSAMAKRRS